MCLFTVVAALLSPWWQLLTMPQLSGYATQCVAFLTGVALHQAIFIHGEWDQETAKIISAVVLSNIAAPIGLVYFLPEQYGILSAVALIASLTASTIAGVFTSIAAYRLFFHRLNRFPGPILARLSNFYPTYLTAKNLRLCDEVEKLHARYGDIVRLGPRELSVNKVEAIQAVHDNKSPCVKGPWYLVDRPYLSLHMERDKKMHNSRRKNWDKGFNAKSLRDYEPRIYQHSDRLLDKIKQSVGKPLDVTEWCSYFSFDVMGEFAFGRSFGMLEMGKPAEFPHLLRQSMVLIGLFSHLVWLLPIFKSFPVLNAEWKKGWDMKRALIDERRKKEPEQPDVVSHLISEFKTSGESPQSLLNLYGDCALLVIAGSDTTSATLTCCLLELALQKDVQRTLQAEVDAYYDDTPNPDATSLAKCKYLQAVIDENLRVNPPVPGGVQRMTPPEGVMIDETWIPGDVIVQIPHYMTHRDERNFKQAQKFIPERWTTRGDLVINAQAWQPFGIGRYSCVGKQFALIEVRHVLAHIFRKYDVSLAPKQSVEEFRKKTMDTFTLSPEKLELVFTERKGRADSPQEENPAEPLLKARIKP